MNIFPGVYTSDIGSSSVAVAITLDFGGDGRTLVPLITTGNMYLSGFTADNTVGGANTAQNNGYGVDLLSAGTTGIALSGSVTSNPFSGGTAGNVVMTALGSGSISQSAGSISGASLSFVTNLGNVGGVGQHLQTVTLPYAIALPAVFTSIKPVRLDWDRRLPAVHSY